MNTLKYYMPTKVIYGPQCILENKGLFGGLGKAFIVTGKSSKENGALADVTAALKDTGIGYAVYDDIEENPSIQCVFKAADIGKKESCGFVIGIGGGSPLDAAKSVAVLIKNPRLNGEDLYNSTVYTALPVIAVPTTAGTGSEVTPLSILTNHEWGTKSSTPQRVFPEIAFLDGKYLKNMPASVMSNTVLDSLCHSIESYLSASSGFLSDKICEGVFEAFGEVKSCLIKKQFSDDVLNRLLLISCMSGMAISQTGTSLPHYLGYKLTYGSGIPHGRACGLLLYEYLCAFNNNDKVMVIVKKLGFSSLIETGDFLKQCLNPIESISASQLEDYISFAMKKPEKLKSFPQKADEELVRGIYLKSFAL